MIYFMISLLLMLVVLAITVTVCKKPLTIIIIFMSYSIINSIIWMLLQSPDLAITEAAVGAGIDTVMFFAAFKRMGIFNKEFNREAKDEEE